MTIRVITCPYTARFSISYPFTTFGHVFHVKLVYSLFVIITGSLNMTKLNHKFIAVWIGHFVWKYVSVLVL